MWWYIYNRTIVFNHLNPDTPPNSTQSRWSNYGVALDTNLPPVLPHTLGSGSGVNSCNVRSCFACRSFWRQRVGEDYQHHLEPKMISTWRCSLCSVSSASLPFGCATSFWRKDLSISTLITGFDGKAAHPWYEKQKSMKELECQLEFWRKTAARVGQKCLYQKSLSHCPFFNSVILSSKRANFGRLPPMVSSFPGVSSSGASIHS